MLKIDSYDLEWKCSTDYCLPEAPHQILNVSALPQ